jgi:hypothetical protein
MGADLDNTVRLEPTEVAGINQAFRGLIPESLAGSIPGARLETYGVSIEQKFDTRTYLSLSGDLFYSPSSQPVGAFSFYAASKETAPIEPTEDFAYRERAVVLTADQLIGRQWEAGVRYQLGQANFSYNFPAVPRGVPSGNSSIPDFFPRQSLDSVLHQVTLHANWNHPSGCFATLEANWYLQSNEGFLPDEPGNDLWQFNILGGYRFWHRKAELAAGVLNLTDRNYELEPLDYYNEMPRARTFVTRFKFCF